NVGRRGPGRDADHRAALRTPAHLDARRGRAERLPPGRLRHADEQEQLALVAELARVRAAVDLLQPLDLVHVVPRLAELDPLVRSLPAVNVVLARVVRG